MFNQNGGGWYATERTESSLKVWFWGRGDASVPDEVRAPTGTDGAVQPLTWGTPTAVFVSDSCDLAAMFGPNAFIINLTLCVRTIVCITDGGVADGSPRRAIASLTPFFERFCELTLLLQGLETHTMAGWARATTR